MAIHKRRSSFTPKNALRFKRIFDTAIDKEQDLLIPITGSPVAFHARCSDALKWLIVYQDKEHVNTLGKPHKPGAYATLRGQIKLKQFEDKRDGKLKLRLAFLKNEIIAEGGEIELIPIPTPEERDAELEQEGNPFPDLWKAKLVKEFLQSPDYIKSGQIFKIKNIKLTEDDMAWAKRMFDEVGNITYDIDVDMIVCKFNVNK